MGIQTTVKISRKAAEKKFVDQELEKKRAELVMVAHFMRDIDLEDAIEEHFYNYRIEEPQDDK